MDWRVASIVAKMAHTKENKRGLCYHCGDPVELQIFRNGRAGAGLHAFFPRIGQYLAAKLGESLVYVEQCPFIEKICALLLTNLRALSSRSGTDIVCSS